MVHVRVFLACIVVGVFAACAGGPRAAGSGPGRPVAIGVTDGLSSAVLGEFRDLNVWLPPGYRDAAAALARYPVVYVLDGGVDEDFHHLSGLVQFLSLYELMPRCIVVGIVNVDRYRDFTHRSAVPEDRESLPTGGGSARFLTFLRDELQPYIARRYRTNGHRTIIGQSMGGLLAVEALVDHPDLFADYVVVSPSLWWGDAALVDRAAAGLAVGAVAGKRVFVSLGKEHPKMHELGDEFVAALRSAAPECRVGYETLPDETHATVLHRAAYRAFEFFYGATHPGM